MWAHSCAPLSISLAGAPSPIYPGRPVPFGDASRCAATYHRHPKTRHCMAIRPTLWWQGTSRSGKARPCHRITAADGCAISPCGSATIIFQYPTETACRHQPIHIPRVHRRHAVTWGGVNPGCTDGESMRGAQLCAPIDESRRCVGLFHADTPPKLFQIYLNISNEFEIIRQHGISMPCWRQSFSVFMCTCIPARPRDRQ